MLSIWKPCSLEGTHERWSTRNPRGRDLSRAYLREADLRGAKYNAGTEWPARFDPVAAGPGLVDGFPAGGGCIV